MSESALSCLRISPGCRLKMSTSCGLELCDKKHSQMFRWGAGGGEGGGEEMFYANMLNMWLCRPTFHMYMYTAQLWQKDTSDKSDISCKRAKCVCHFHWHQWNTILIICCLKNWKMSVYNRIKSVLEEEYTIHVGTI